MESFQQLLTARIQEFVEEVWPYSVLTGVEKYHPVIYEVSVMIFMTAFCLLIGSERESLRLRMKIILNYFCMCRLFLPLSVEWLPSLKRQSLFWNEDRDKLSGQMKVCRLLSFCFARVDFIYVLISSLCTAWAENLLALLTTFVVAVKTLASVSTDNPFSGPLLHQWTLYTKSCIFLACYWFLVSI